MVVVVVVYDMVNIDRDDDDDDAGNDSVNGVGTALRFLSSLHHPHVLSIPKVGIVSTIIIKGSPKLAIRTPKK